MSMGAMWRERQLTQFEGKVESVGANLWGVLSGLVKCS